ncbi:MAG: tRNA lysidine(34) synthetase TilS [Chloroflexota bacterium]|nr:tRNA lysidine(34) synthetase TilS [Chloroflexota bacterium]
MTQIESRVIDFVNQHNLLPPQETIIVGVSGGADSVCLLCFLQKYRKELGIKIHVAHLNHGLRGAESEADARYVFELANSSSLPITIDRQDVVAHKTKRRCSLEEAARELRYAFFTQVAEKAGARRIAIGHTRNDQAETVLMHILRGTGTSGLRGLEPCSPIPPGGSGLLPSNQIKVIRPLLDITREETLNYCQELELGPRTDSSNLSLSFLRNRLRLELLPLLRKYNPNFDEALLRLAEIARDDSIFIEEQAFGLWNEVAGQENNVVYLDREKIGLLPIALQRQLIRLAIARILGDIRDVEANHIEAVRSLLRKPVGKRISLPHGLICWGEYSNVAITKGQNLVPSKAKDLSQCPFPPPLSLRAEGEAIPLEVPGETILPGWRVLASIVETLTQTLSLQGRGKVEGEKGRGFVAEFDLHRTGTELLVRRRQPGDKFQPLGMSMPKKLQAFMIDAKIPLSWRERIPIVFSPGQIIWVVGYRIDDKVKVTGATKEILQLEFIRSS